MWFVSYKITSSIILLKKGGFFIVSVTRRITQIKQPRGGYVKPKEFTVIDLDDNQQLYTDENEHGIIIGLAVDYLTRFSLGTPSKKAFEISIRGAININKLDYAIQLLDSIVGLDDESIINACKLVGFDVVFRAGTIAYTRPAETIAPDEDTISNIRIMVERSLAFFKEYGPAIQDGFSFEGGYTNLIDTGDGDFLTETGLWDFKVSKTAPTKNHTLQLLVYYLMGMNSIHDEFKNIKQLGIFNPRLNKVYLFNLDNIASEVITEVSSEVIGY